jgi:phosphate transport system permease protein
MIEVVKVRRSSIKRKIMGSFLLLFGIASLLLGLFGLALLLFDIFSDGLAWLSWSFLTNYPSRHPEQAGIKSAVFGSIWVVGFTALISVPLGVGAAIYLEEYAKPGRLVSFIRASIANLAGVPSIVYGLLGLGLFVDMMKMGRSILAGALTLSLLVLPIVIISAREAIYSVPRSYRLAAFALGATRWQVVRHVILPISLPGILTGTILAVSRAIGEAAPMIAIAALAFVPFVPTSPLDRFTVLPIQIFNWISRPQKEFHSLAAAGIIVLLLLLIGMNAIAIYIRNRYQRRLAE